MNKKLAAIGLAAVLALGLAGCSGGATDEDAAAQAAEDFMNGMIHGDGEVVCGLSLREGKVVTDADPDWAACVTSVSTLADTLAPALEAEGITEVVVKKVTVTDDTATLKASDIDGDIFRGEQSELNLRKIDGKWYMDSPS